MDIRMPGLDGIEATRLIAADEDLAGVKVLVLTTYDTDENIVEALRAGASGFLVKDTRPAELLDASARWPRATSCCRRGRPPGSSPASCAAPPRPRPRAAPSVCRTVSARC